MKPARFMDSRLDKVDALNELLSIQTPEYTSAIAKKRRTGTGEKKDGAGDAGGLFGAVTSEMFFRADGGTRPQVAGIIHPSDGHPQQEHCPDFNWFRPLTWNNPTWTLYWPELII